MTMTGKNTLGLISFVVRCTAAATIAYLLANAVGLPRPLWACIFALIASQGSSAGTFVTVGGRVIGTLIGVVVTVVVGTLSSRLGLAAQTAIAVAICAVFAWGRPAIQLCLWTPPIVLMTAGPSDSIIDVGFYRGCEVILGRLIGGLLLAGAEKLGAWENARRVPRKAHP